MDALPSADVWEFYGASEGGVSRISPDEWRERPGSVGRPWPGVEVTIRASADTDEARRALMALPLAGLEAFVRRAGRPEPARSGRSQIGTAAGPDAASMLIA